MPAFLRRFSLPHPHIALPKAAAVATHHNCNYTIDILSAFYRTLDVTPYVRTETASYTSTPVTIDPWIAIPWSNPDLLEAPHPDILVIAWRLRFRDGAFSAVQTTMSPPGEAITFRDDQVKQKLRDSGFVEEETCDRRVWVVSALYYDVQHGPRDVTTTIANFVARTLDGAREHTDQSSIAFTVDDAMLRPDTTCSLAETKAKVISGARNAERSQLYVTYGVKNENGNGTFHTLAGATGDTICICFEGTLKGSKTEAMWEPSAKWLGWWEGPLAHAGQKESKRLSWVGA